MDLFSNVIGVAGVFLHVVLLFLLIRGPFRRYFVIFVYCLAQTVLVVLDGLILRKFGQSSAQYRTMFWTDAMIVDVLLLLVVIVLTYQALEGNPLRSKMTRILVIFSAIIAILPFVVLRRPLFMTRWFNGTDQILEFGVAIMNLGLWTALLGSKKRDRQLLTVTAGLGARVAATALLLGLRHFTAGGGMAREIDDISARLTFLAGTLIWCWAFRPAMRPRQSSPAAIRTSTPA